MKRYFTGVTLLLLAFTAQAMAAAAPAVKPKVQAPAPAKTTTAAPSKFKTDPITGMELVLVKGGCYNMGTLNGDTNEQYVRNVCVSDFYMGKYEVTQGQWEKVTGNNPSFFRQCGLNCPVEAVSWNSAQEFILKLNATSNSKFRLPTEAEWEYAAKSGGQVQKYAGTNADARLDEYAWYDKNSGGMTHPVGLKKPNGLGLYDMSGNVWEWCQDEDNLTKGKGDTKMILRGGSWINIDNYARTAFRNRYEPGSGFDMYGFRLVLPVK